MKHTIDKELARRSRTERVIAEFISQDTPPPQKAPVNKRLSRRERRKAKQPPQPFDGPVGKWEFVEVKHIGYRPEVVDRTKPMYATITTASGKDMYLRVERKPGPAQVTVFRKITFPCSRLILKHSISGGLIRVGYSKTTNKCVSHQPVSKLNPDGCPSCKGVGHITSNKFTVSKVEEDEDGQYVPVGEQLRMDRSEFSVYSKERFGVDYAMILESYSQSMGE